MRSPLASWIPPRARLPRTAALVALLAAQLGSVDAAAADAPSDPAASTAPHPVGAALVTVGVDLEIGGRRLSFSDLLSENMRSYDVMGVPMPALRAEVFPLARSGVPVLSDIGVGLAYARAFGLESAAPDGTQTDTSWSRMHADLQGRLCPLGDQGPILLVTGGLRWTEFGFDAEGQLAREVASVSYVALRLGGGARVPFGPMAIEAGGGYQAPLDTGELAGRFRKPSAGGVDLYAAVAVPLAPLLNGFEARLGATYTRFFYSFESEPEDTYIAGGVLDQFFAAQLGATYVY